jgi:hypothetical protein
MKRLLLLVCLLLASPVWATTWYVRKDGSDTGCTGLADAAYDGAGTGEACAFLTIKKAISLHTSAAADSVLIGPGVYREGGIAIDRGGLNAGAQFTIKGIGAPYSTILEGVAATPVSPSDFVWCGDGANDCDGNGATAETQPELWKIGAAAGFGWVETAAWTAKDVWDKHASNQTRFNLAYSIPYTNALNVVDTVGYCTPGFECLQKIPGLFLYNTNGYYLVHMMDCPYPDAGTCSTETPQKHGLLNLPTSIPATLDSLLYTAEAASFVRTENLYGRYSYGPGFSLRGDSPYVKDVKIESVRSVGLWVKPESVSSTILNYTGAGFFQRRSFEGGDGVNCYTKDCGWTENGGSPWALKVEGGNPAATSGHLIDGVTVEQGYNLVSPENTANSIFRDIFAKNAPNHAFYVVGHGTTCAGNRFDRIVSFNAQEAGFDVQGCSGSDNIASRIWASVGPSEQSQNSPAWEPSPGWQQYNSIKASQGVDGDENADGRSSQTGFQADFNWIGASTGCRWGTTQGLDCRDNVTGWRAAANCNCDATMRTGTLSLSGVTWPLANGVTASTKVRSDFYPLVGSTGTIDQGTAKDMDRDGITDVCDAAHHCSGAGFDIGPYEYGIDTPGAPSDTTAPGTIDDLVAGSPTATTIRLEWTPTGDDGETGTATSYAIKRVLGACTGIDTEAEFDAATTVTCQGGNPTPGVAGSATKDVCIATGLASAQQYCFSVRAFDERGDPAGEGPIASPLTNATATTSAAPAGCTFTDETSFENCIDTACGSSGAKTITAAGSGQTYTFTTNSTRQTEREIPAACSATSLLFDFGINNTYRPDFLWWDAGTGNTATGGLSSFCGTCTGGTNPGTACTPGVGSDCIGGTCTARDCDGGWNGGTAGDNMPEDCTVQEIPSVEGYRFVMIRALTTNVTIEGNGSSTIYGWHDGINFDGASDGLSGVSGQIIQGLNCDRPADDCYTSEPGTGSQSSRGANTIRNLRVENACDKAIQIGGLATDGHSGDDLLIDNVTFNNCRQPIRNNDYGRFRIEDSTITENQPPANFLCDEGPRFDTSGVCTGGAEPPGTKCDASNVCLSGGTCDTEKSYTYWLRNTVDGCGRCLRIAGDAEMLIQDSTFRNCERVGVGIYDGAQVSMRGTTVQNNGGTTSSQTIYGGVSISEAAVADLGGGSLTLDGGAVVSPGGNTINGNVAPGDSARDIEILRTSYALKAESNCWGDPDPQDQFDLATGSTVDHEPLNASCAPPPPPPSGTGGTGVKIKGNRKKP